MFVLEEHDRNVLSHPREAIVDEGDTILCVSSPAHGMVGTGTLMRPRSATFPC